jgi:hypothetical protein
MTRHLALIFGFTALLGAAAPALADGPVPTCPPVVKHTVVHRHWVHRFVAHRVYVAMAPTCGSVVHPCNVDHLTVPEQ